MKIYSARNALGRHKIAITGSVSMKALFAQFSPPSKGSVRSLLIHMGPFEPNSDAFRFGNSFPLPVQRAAQLREPIEAALLNAVTPRIVSKYKVKLDSIKIKIPPIGPTISLPDVIIGRVLDKVQSFLIAQLWDEVIGPIPGRYGRCGGMAFAGLDFYQLGWPVDERLGTTPPESGELGDYIFKRLLDSLELNALTFTEWVIDLHLLPKLDEIATAALLASAGSFAFPIGTAIGAYIGSRMDIFDSGGADSILDKTKREWPKIKAKLDREAAWPIGLIYGDTPNPIDQHQVLAVGYSDNNNGTAILSVWDNNDTNYQRDLTLNFTGHELMVSHYTRGVKGIFLEEYIFQQPPASLRFS